MKVRYNVRHLILALAAETDTKISNEDISRETGISRNAVSNMMRGVPSRRIHMKVIEGMYKYFSKRGKEYTLDDFLIIVKTEDK